MSARAPSRPTTARPWHARCREAVWAVWAALQRVCARPRSQRDRYLGRASSHADLELRMREWSDFERRPWLPPR